MEVCQKNIVSPEYYFSLIKTIIKENNKKKLGYPQIVINISKKIYIQIIGNIFEILCTYYIRYRIKINKV